MIDVAARIHLDDDRVGADMLDWAQTTHDAAFGALLHRSGALARWWFEDPGDQLRMTWAMSDGLPDDGGPPLAARYASRSDLPERDRAIAERIAAARIGLYRVDGVVPGAWVEIEALDGNAARRRVMSANVSSAMQSHSLVLARVMDADGVASFWGPACRYPAEDERKWLAFVRAHDLTTAEGALAALDFIPEDHAEPLDENLRLLSTEWAVDDDLVVCEQLSDSPQAVDLGLQIGAGDDVWALAWLDRPRPAVIDLGGWGEDPERIEVARLIVYPDRMCALSTSRAVLAEVEAWVEDNLDGLTSTLFRAA